jgi:hypothetical protein
MTPDEPKPLPEQTNGSGGHARAAAAPEDPETDESDESESAAEDEAEEASPEPPPAIVAELAAACVRFVATRYGVMLDFQPDTLSLVDQYVHDARAELAVKPQVLELVQGAAGAYLGEVLRLHFGGEWFADGDQDGWRVDFNRVFLSFNPIGMIREALLLEAQDGWHAHLEMDPAERGFVEPRLEALPEVDEAEYFAPTTRFDVVSLAHDALRAHMIESGLGEVRFTREDYRR